MFASFFRLPLRFDAELLKADLASMPPADWRTHFNAQYHDGGWTGIALRSVDGRPESLYPGPVENATYSDTPVLTDLPNIRDALGRFHCPLEAVRLLRLMAGGRIHEHRDYGLGVEHGVVRVHIPLIAAPDVEFYVDGERVFMQEGECWYLDLSLPHRVHNLGSTDRIHLVLDCAVEGWLLSLFPTEEEALVQRTEPQYLAAVEASLQRQFDKFRTLALADMQLQQRLHGLDDDLAEFTAQVVAMGREAGFRFTEDEVKAALAQGRRAAIERMILQ
jgi:hypothetical protein